MQLDRKQKLYLTGALLTALCFTFFALNYNDAIMITFDMKVGSAVYDLFGKGWVPVIARVTDLGSGKFCFPLTAALIIYFLIRKKDWLIALLIFNLIGVRFANHILKAIFERPRPSFDHLVHVSYYSFPSGHSMDAMAFYSFLAFLLHVRLKESGKRTEAVWVAAVSLIVIIGLTRIYLGVHYPTDVLGGFSAGACWLFLTLLFYSFVPTRR